MTDQPAPRFRRLKIVALIALAVITLPITLMVLAGAVSQRGGR